MKKLIFRFWIANILVGLALFLMYRIVISETDSETETFFQTFMFILELFLSLGYSLIYIAVALISSLLILLNLFKKIRSHYYLSMLTFLGIPIVGNLYIIWIMLAIHDRSGSYSPDFAITFLIFSLIYLAVNMIQFLMFRKKINTTLPDDKQ